MDMKTWEDACKLQSESNAGRDLLTWSVCENPKDFPGKFTAVPSSMFLNQTIDFVLVAGSLAGIRKMLPPGLVRMEREPNDEPVVVEVWI
jgi:hypothetical protein